MSPIWRALYAAESLDPALDDDGDGSTNLEESLAGTNPFNANDRFVVSTVRIQTEGILLRWTAAVGRTYTIEHRTDSETDWQPIMTGIAGQGGQREVLVTGLLPGNGELHLKIDALNQAEEAALEAMGGQDTDADGQSDVVEYLAGTHPFDPASTFAITDTLTGPFIELQWPGVEGKDYQVQCSTDLSGNSWINLGGVRNGVTGNMNAAYALSELPGRFFRVTVSDRPSEIQGLSEWEASQLGLDPIQRNKFRRDGLDIGQFLALPNVIEVETPEPVANVTRNGIGMVEIRRTQGVQPLTLPFTVTGTAIPGTDYLILPSEIVLPFGAKSVSIPIIPLPGYQENSAKSVTLTFQIPTSNGPQTNTITVNLIRESAISVTDFGAVGDGVTDDTSAIQAAIVALENSTTHNTLWFPVGVYRLSQLTFQTDTSGSHYRTLFLGATDLSGRDLVFAGAPNATLLSKTGSTRSHILLTRARWRSLSFHDLTFEKDSQPLLLVTPASEPNGAYGVAAIDYNNQSVEKLSFEGCKFINCHGAIRAYSNGLDIWGHLKQFRMNECEVLNPYGSNTVEGSTAYGGGQQVNLTPWVGNATYTQNLFVGGPDVVTDLNLNPGGIPKDGCHFGAPRRLLFSDNTVQNMGVEAVFQANEPIGGYTAVSFLAPPENSQETASVKVIPQLTTFQSGQIFTFRFSESGIRKNYILRVVSYDSQTRILELANDGMSNTNINHESIPQGAQIYLQSDEPNLAILSNNIVTTATERKGTGIAINSNFQISDNFIHGYLVSINEYAEDKSILFPPEKNSIIARNKISLPAIPDITYFSYGINAWGKSIDIYNNFINCHVSKKCYGIVANGDRTGIFGNQIAASTILVNGYNSHNRAVGIGIANTATNTHVNGNSTRGFDVGLGAKNPYQAIPFYSKSHDSWQDTLAVDTGGLIPE